MEQFHDGHHVWLRSRVRGTYLHADDDGRSVSLRPNRASRNAAWGVQIIHRESTYLLLYSAAYGRYLAASDVPAPLGHRGFRVRQQGFDEQEVDAIMWKAVGSGVYGDYVLLRNLLGPFLRANGRYLRWNTGVSVDEFFNLSSMMYWVVEPIPPRNTIPPFPAPHERPYGSLAAMLGLDLGPPREVRYVQANQEGFFAENEWETFQFRGRSVYRLRSELAGRMGEAVFYHNLVMCLRAGRYGRLTPLVVDLPRCTDPVDIVMLMSSSLAYRTMRHPNVDAPP